jgi:adenylylsulfate kinase
MGLPGAGKSTLAKALTAELKAEWFNADDVRKIYDDWDFSVEGRIRQAKRLHFLSNNSTRRIVVVDFIAPLKEQRKIFKADYTIWMDTLQESRYDDTNKLFEQPVTECDLRLTSFNQYNIEEISQLILNNK